MEIEKLTKYRERFTSLTWLNLLQYGVFYKGMNQFFPPAPTASKYDA